MNDQRNTTTAYDQGSDLRDQGSDLETSDRCLIPDPWSLIPEVLAQRELWLLISAALVDPYNRQRFDLLRDPAFRQRVLTAAATAHRVVDSAVELGLGEVHPQTLSPEAFFTAMDGQDHETIETTYRQVFGLTAISEQCPPCEIEWEPNTDVFYRCQRLADIGGFYQAFGLQVSTRAGERLDHITAQAEFLYVLLAKEAAAQDAGNQEGVEICRDARRKFFQEHVGWWLPAFAHVLSRVAPIGYYSQLATLIAGVSALERVALGLPPLTRRLARGPAPPKLSQVEAEAGCGNSADCPQGSL